MRDPTSPNTQIPGELALGGYLISALVGIVPAFDNALLAWPLRPGDAHWRFGTVGVMTRALPPLALGLLLAMVLAIVVVDRWRLRLVSVLSGLLSATLLIVVPFFLLDALQLRTTVQAQALRAFDVSAVAAVVKMLLTATAAAGVARAGWKASGRMRLPESASGSEAQPRRIFAPGGSRVLSSLSRSTPP